MNWGDIFNFKDDLTVGWARKAGYVFTERVDVQVNFWFPCLKKSDLSNCDFFFYAEGVAWWDW